MVAHVIKNLIAERQAHLAQALYHDGEARGHQRRMANEMAKAVERRARAWECEVAIKRLGGEVEE